MIKRSLPVFLLLFSLNAHGALSKWVDDEGVVHYSDEPPPANVKAQTLTPPPPADAPPQKTTAEREAEWKKAQKAKESAEQKAEQRQENAEAMQKNCTTAKNNLKALMSDAPLSVFNDKGETVRMDDATRKQRIDEARKQISSSCGAD